MAITSQLAKDVRTVFHEELNSRQRAALLRLVLELHVEVISLGKAS